jgi:hypothetical protein
MSDRPTITSAVARGVLDDQLAALLWLLCEADVPLCLAGRPGSGRRELGAAINSLLDAAHGSPAADVRQRVVDADSLEDLLGPASAAPGASIPDQLRGLGTVLVMRDAPGLGSRVATAHYLRPVERDAAGHLQRRPPALLAAWDEPGDQFDHFWWGITAELADRTRMAVADFEAAQRDRSGMLAGLVAAGLLEAADLRRQVFALRAGGAVFATVPLVPGDSPGDSEGRKTPRSAPRSHEGH